MLELAVILFFTYIAAFLNYMGIAFTIICFNASVIMGTFAFGFLITTNLMMAGIAWETTAYYKHGYTPWFAIKDKAKKLLKK